MAGGIDWFRWHHGSVTDPKFQLVARKAGCRLSDVLAVWAFILEKASASDDRGHFGELDVEAVDCLFGFDDGTTSAVLLHMTSRGLVDGGAVLSWEKRQPKREREPSGEGSSAKTSTERSRAHRANQNQAEPHADAQRHATPCNASDGQETPREEERREEKNSPSLRSGESAPKRAAPPAASKPEDVSDQTWADFLALRKAKKAPVTVTVIENARVESVKASMGLEQFLVIWCGRGSQGLQAEWLKPHERGSPSGPVTFADKAKARMDALTGRGANGSTTTPKFMGEVIDVADRLGH
jgi:hypothetical protein